MKYVQEKNGVFVRQILDTNPTRWDKDNFCFAYRLSPELSEKFGVSKLKVVTPPYFDPLRQRRREIDPVYTDGQWVQTYIVEELTPEELEELRLIEVDAVKTQRNKLLQESDWTQLPDVSEDLRVTYIQYRQELRDITLQEGYPFDVVWPTQPE